MDRYESFDELCRHAVEGRDFRIRTVSRPGQVAVSGRADELLFVALVLAQSRNRAIGKTRRHTNLLHGFAQEASQLLFPDVGVSARTSIAGAVVVDVLALLDLGKRVLALGMIRRFERVMHRFEQAP